jgi:hypothetical protein
MDDRDDLLHRRSSQTQTLEPLVIAIVFDRLVTRVLTLVVQPTFNAALQDLRGTRDHIPLRSVSAESDQVAVEASDQFECQVRWPVARDGRQFPPDPVSRPTGNHDITRGARRRTGKVGLGGSRSVSNRPHVAPSAKFRW